MSYYYKSAQELTRDEQRKLISAAANRMDTESLASAILGELEQAYPTDDCGMGKVIKDMGLATGICRTQCESAPEDIERALELQSKVREAHNPFTPQSMDSLPALAAQMAMDDTVNTPMGKGWPPGHHKTFSLAGPLPTAAELGLPDGTVIEPDDGVPW